MAKLRFYWGSMGSSKTLNLLATAYNLQEKGIAFIALKPSTDTRDEEGMITSRAGLKRPCVMVDADTDIYKSVKEYNKVISQDGNNLRWVLVDECQFLTEKQVDELSDIVDYMDVDVMCYGLRTDFQSKLFPASKRLFELADEFYEVKSSCECNNKASINARFDPDGNIITEGEQILVGGDDVYCPVCRKCWKEKKTQGLLTKIMEEENFSDETGD